MEEHSVLGLETVGGRAAPNDHTAMNFFATLILVGMTVTGCGHRHARAVHRESLPEDYSRAVGNLSKAIDAEEQIKWAKALREIMAGPHMPNIRYPSLSFLPLDSDDIPLGWATVSVEPDRVKAFLITDIPYDGFEQFPAVKVTVITNEVVKLLRGAVLGAPK